MEFWQGFCLGYLAGVLLVGFLARKVGVLGKILDYLDDSMLTEEAKQEKRK
jgi:hypothetical protein